MPRLETVRAKVGAKLLDLFRPGWAERVNPNTLDLSSCFSCVLGQEFGEYGAGSEKLFAMRADTDGFEGREEASEQAGFVINNGDEHTNYINLTRAWKREIDKRVRA